MPAAAIPPMQILSFHEAHGQSCVRGASLECAGPGFDPQQFRIVKSKHRLGVEGGGTFSFSFETRSC